MAMLNSYVSVYQRVPNGVSVNVAFNQGFTERSAPRSWKMIVACHFEQGPSMVGIQ